MAKKVKNYEYDRSTVAIPTAPHRRLKSRASLLGATQQDWLGLAADFWAELPGADAAEVEKNAKLALDLLAWHASDEEVRNQFASWEKLNAMGQKAKTAKKKRG